MPNPLPNLPTFTFQGPQSPIQPTFQSIVELLKQQPQSLTNQALPAIQAQFDQTSKNLAPALEQIRQTTGQNVAEAQSGAMSRGLTGSDIEAASMQAARGAGGAQEAQLVGQAGLQQAQTVSNAILQSLTQDVQANREWLSQLAQAMGQELTSQRDMDMFAKQLHAMMEASGNYQQALQFASLMGLVGTIGGAVAGGPIGAAIGKNIAGTV